MTWQKNKNYILTLTLSFLLLSIYSPSVYGFSWNKINIKDILGKSSNFKGVAYGNNKYVAVGDEGAISTSDDGVKWTARDSGSSYDLRSVTYGANSFIAVGDDGTVLASTDGITWATRDKETYNLLNDVIYANNLFVCVGAWGNVLTSIDGVHWEFNEIPNGGELFGITYGNNTFVAVGDAGGIFISQNGISWVKSNSETDRQLEDISYGNNTFVAIGNKLDWDVIRVIVLTSSNGITWSPAPEADILYGNVVYGIAYGNNKFCIAGNDTILTSTDTNTWEKKSPETSVILKGIAYCNDAFVSVGDNDAIVNSPDGDIWSVKEVTSYDSYDFNKIAYCNNTFVAVGKGGVIISSSDGDIWDKKNSGTFYNLNGITYGNNIFTAVGDNGTILTSSDGNVWAGKTSGISENLNGITYGSSMFIAVGNKGTVITSTDGETWTPQNDLGVSDPEKEFINFNSLTCGNNMFVAVGNDLNNKSIIFTSMDGIIWAKMILDPYTYHYRPLFDVIYGNNIFVAVGNNDSESTIFTSIDGINWVETPYYYESNLDLSGVACSQNTFVAMGGNTLISTDTTNTWVSRTSTKVKSVCYGNNVFAAVGTGVISISKDDGNIWKNINLLEDKSPRSVTYNNNIYIAVGGGGTKLTSTDGKTWVNKEKSFSYTLNGITHSNDTFIAVGKAGTIQASSDGNAWISKTSGISYDLNGVTYGNNTFVAVGDSGQVLFSPDGNMWGKGSGTFGNLEGVTYGGNIFVAVGAKGHIFTSSDGNTWTSQTSGTTDWLYGVTYGNNTFVAVGSLGYTNSCSNIVKWDGIILTSPNGVDWKIVYHGDLSGPGGWYSYTTHISGNLYGVVYVNNMFVAVGGSSVYNDWSPSESLSATVLTSRDGNDWAWNDPDVSRSSLHGIVYGNNTLVAVAEKGLILQTDPLLPSISVASVSVNFDSTTAGALSSPRMIAIKNTGEANLDMGTIYLSGTDSGAFKIQNDNFSGKTLSPSEASFVEIIFSPSSVGEKTANLIIPSNDPYNSTLTVSLTGVGVAKANQAPKVSITAVPVSGESPLSVNFTTSVQDDGTIVKYEWDLDGDGVYEKDTGTSSTISFTYANANTYTVKVRVTDNGGLKAENSVTITVTSVVGSSLKGNIDTTSPGSANRVDGHDLYVLAKAFGSNSQSPNYNSAADLDGSGTVDGNDLVTLAANFGKSN